MRPRGPCQRVSQLFFRFFLHWGKMSSQEGGPALDGLFPTSLDARKHREGIGRLARPAQLPAGNPPFYGRDDGVYPVIYRCVSHVDRINMGDTPVYRRCSTGAAQGEPRGSLPGMWGSYPGWARLELLEVEPLGSRKRRTSAAPLVWGPKNMDGRARKGENTAVTPTP
jgi:hypothetical protein